MKRIANRVLCIIISALFISGTFCNPLSHVSVNAAENTVTGPFEKDDVFVRVGICYSDDCEEGYRIRPSHEQLGFDIYTTTRDHAFGYICTISDKNDVFFAKGGNLYKYDETSSKSVYKSTSDVKKATVGGYHILLPNTYASYEEVTDNITDISSAYKNTALIPAFINGNHRILLGAYFTDDEANEALKEIEKEFEGATVLSPGQTEVVILDYESGEFIYYFDTQDEFGFGCYPKRTDGQYNYLKMQNGYYRPGVFEFRRFKDDTVDGIALVMISEMEEYVESVMPWEIYTSWPSETLKAFAICVRTVAYSNAGKHAKYGFDVCATSNCQNSKGHSRVDDAVRQAVAATKGQIIVCDGKPTLSYYSSLGGGSMAAAHQIWNQLPEKYLVGQFTPWEQYKDHKYGSWQFEATPEELCASLRSEGYTQLKDAISDIEILELCDNSTYVYAVKVTDTRGNSVTINRSRTVYKAFADYLHTSNFVVKHNGAISDGMDASPTGIYVITANGVKMIPPNEEIHVATDTDIKTTVLPNVLSVNASIGGVSLDVMAEAKKFVSDALTPEEDEENGNFIFIGKGNGHGAGISQIGMRDLGNLGYDYKEMIYKYYPNTQIVTHEEYIAMQK